MSGPLEGVRIIDLTTIISGPMATQMLGDQGADIVKVERFGAPDGGRQMGARRGGMGAAGAIMNRNKRSIVIDLQKAEGRELLLELARGGDVLVHNFRPGVMDRLKLGYETIRQINPALIYTSISGFGQSGPYVKKRVYDAVIQAGVGYAAMQADPETGEPQMVRSYLVDKLTALTAAQAISSALFERLNKKRGGQHLQLSMMDAGLSFLWLDGFWNLSHIGDEVENIPNLSETYRVIKTKDGFMAFLGGFSPSQWPGLLRAIDRPDLAGDPRFATMEDRRKNRYLCLDIVREECAKWTTDEICARMDKEELASSKVQTREEVLSDPQVHHNELIFEFEHPARGRMRQARPAALFDGAVTKVRRPAPDPGEHTDEILAGIGITKERIAALKERGIVA